MGVAIIALTIGYNVHTSKQNVEMSNLTMTNIEALAQNESGEFEYPNSFPFVTVCNVAIGENIFGIQRCKATIIVCQGGGNGCNSRRCPVHS